MNKIFHYAHIVAGLLLFVVGFVFHWLGQLTGIINRGFVTRRGLQEKRLPEVGGGRLTAIAN